MAEPLAPQDIARRTFSVARRGYEQQEVRGFLHEVSSLLERLNRAEAELRERAERAEAKLGLAAEPDEAMLLEILGEETTRVLTSAREAAAEIRSKAESAAERVIAEATTEAAELRSRAVHDADALMAETKAESESLLESARNELDRRRAEASEEAVRMLADAEAKAEDMKQEAEAEVAARRQEGEEAVETARQQGREMVAEAQAVRERVLRDLVARRKKARQQVEKLNAGRERLLQAYDVVRRTVDEATGELHVSLVDARIAADAASRRIEDEAEPTFEQLDEEVATAALVDLPIVEIDPDDDGPGPFSGEVPAVEAEIEPTAEPSAPAEQSEPDPATDRPDPQPEPESAPPADGPALVERRPRKGRRRKAFEGLPSAPLTVVQAGDPAEGVRILADTAGPPDAEVEVEVEVEEAVQPVEPSEMTEGVEPAEAEEDDPTDEDAAPDPVGRREAPPKVDDVFARLRAEQGEDDVAEAGAADDAVDIGAAAAIGAADDTTEGPAALERPEPADEVGAAEVPSADGGAFEARAEAVGPVEKDLSRRLKRVLADEQNEVLDLLRRAKPKGVDDLLPAAAEHVARWAEAASEALGEAAAAGSGRSGAPAPPCEGLAREMAESLVAPLRERIDRSFSASDGNLDEVTDRVRALYREWKGKRLSEASDHFVRAAYAWGVFEGIDASGPVRWVLDPSAGACPDCDDNVLAGAIAKGEAFPTGSPCAPAHTGCHCLVLPATG